MRPFLISVMLLGLVAGCSTPVIGPHRIDVQQGNALDKENLERLKPGLSRSQVRFLLGTPLVVDPFRNDRWDYVYTYAKAGKLTEQRRVSLFFEGDTLVRVEGDVPTASEKAPAQAAPANASAAPATQSESAPSSAATARAIPEPETPPAPAARIVPETQPTPPARAVPETPPAPAARAAAEAQPLAQTAAAETQAERKAMAPQTSVVAPLAAPKGAPPYVDPRAGTGMSLQPATRVEAIQPDVIPAFPFPQAAAAVEAPVLGALEAWTGAWKRRDAENYLAAYDAAFVPADGSARADWEKRRRTLFRLARSIDVRIEAPTVERQEEGTVNVTFNQFYASDSYRDAVVKQLVMVERGGRWLILEERVLKTLAGAAR